LVLCTALEEEAAVFDFQVRQIDDRTLSLQLAGREGGTDDAPGGGREARRRRCHAVLQQFARTQGVKSLHIVDQPGEHLPLGRSGKLQRVVARQAAPGRASAAAR
jgi:hypothetical protein